jgi:low temperature requirement protein LtrA
MLTCRTCTAGLNSTVASTDAKPLPFVHYAILITCVDVAHVWGTLFRTYLDTEATNKRWKLFYLSPPAILLVEIVAYWISPTFFWSCVAYFAIYHFISQNYGLLALYKARHGERNRVDYKLDYYTLVAGAVCPVLLW